MPQAAMELSHLLGVIGVAGASAGSGAEMLGLLRASDSIDACAASADLVIDSVVPMVTSAVVATSLMATKSTVLTTPMTVVSVAASTAVTLLQPPLP